MNQIQIHASKLGMRLWRNNVAKAYQGSRVHHFQYPQHIEVNPGDVVIRNARIIHAGLCEGSSDLIGVKPIVVTEDMVGSTVGIFTAVEVKTASGKTTESQDNFIRVIKQLGGLARVARNTEDLEELDGAGKQT